MIDLSLCLPLKPCIASSNNIFLQDTTLTWMILIDAWKMCQSWSLGVCFLEGSSSRGYWHPKKDLNIPRRLAALKVLHQTLHSLNYYRSQDQCSVIQTSFLFLDLVILHKKHTNQHASVFSLQRIHTNFCKCLRLHRIDMLSSWCSSSNR